MVDLYTPTGFHLYGAQKITGDDIGAHLRNPAVSHEELTPLLLVSEEPGRRYVVTQGIENTVFATKGPSGLSWEIVAGSDGTLRIAQSAWLRISANQIRSAITLVSPVSHCPAARLNTAPEHNTEGKELAEAR